MGYNTSDFGLPTEYWDFIAENLEGYEGNEDVTLSNDISVILGQGTEDIEVYRSVLKDNPNPSEAGVVVDVSLYVRALEDKIKALERPRPMLLLCGYGPVRTYEAEGIRAVVNEHSEDARLYWVDERNTLEALKVLEGEWAFVKLTETEDQMLAISGLELEYAPSLQELI